MKVLFIARHFTYFRNFESVIAALAERGHRLHLAADREEALGGRELVDRLAARFPGQVTVEFTPILNWGRYRRVSQALRIGLDYLRYLDPRYDQAAVLRARAYDRTPRFVLLLARLPWRRLVVRVLERVELAIPRHAGVDEYLRGHQPDLLLITPLVELGAPQLDYLRAARALRIRSALCVWSWDHLSSKGLIREIPDRLLVWNAAQRGEAAAFHGIPPERVVVTGAQCFDQWFDRTPARDRDTFCRRVGLPSDRPLILYVCSVLLKHKEPEVAFLLRWLDAVRRDGRLRDAAILVRPHPQRMEEWTAEARSAIARAGPVSLWGANPVDPESRNDYFDSLFHAAAVIGINTSAMVEAAIVDRPVLTVMLPEFHDNQLGNFHWPHLMNVGGGFLNVAHSLDEHTRQLAALLRNETWSGFPRSNRPFVEHFIRPRGAATAATAVFADAVEEIARDTPPQPRRSDAWRILLRPVIYALVLAGRLPYLERVYWNPKKLIRHS
jgi:hypothetical protein